MMPRPSASTSSLLPCSELAHPQSSAAALSAHAQASLGELTERIAAVIAELTHVKNRSSYPDSDTIPDSESAVAQLKEALEKRVRPLFARATARAQGTVNAVVSTKSPSLASVSVNSHNGVGH